MRCIILFIMLGASSLGSVFRETNELESIKVVHHAIKSGINYIDVAPWYGHGKAETVLGKVNIYNIIFHTLCIKYDVTIPTIFEKILKKIKRTHSKQVAH